MNTYLQRSRRGTVAPSVGFDDIGRDSSANRRSNVARVPSDRVYFRDLRKLVSNAFLFKKKQSQNIQQSQISPRVSAQGTSRRSPPYYTSVNDNTYFSDVPSRSRREPVLSRARRRLAEAKKYRIGMLPEDMIIKILGHTVAHEETVLDIILLNTYIEERKKIAAFSRVNNDVYESFLQNILTVHLENVEITDEILEILKNTITERSKISTIILRNITFSNDEIRINFLEYLSKNTKLKILILDNVDIDRDNFNNFLSILENFKDLELLEFSNFNITRLFKVSVINNVQFHYFFMKVIINLQLNYLIFNNNIITQKDYTYLFNKLNDVNNYYVIDLGIDGGRDGIYLKYNDNKDDDNEVKSGEQFMHIIEIDTAGRKTLCVDRYSIDFHTYGNKDGLLKLNNFRHKYISKDATFLFKEYKVPLKLLSTF